MSSLLVVPLGFLKIILLRRWSVRQPGLWIVVIATLVPVPLKSPALTMLLVFPTCDCGGGLSERETDREWSLSSPLGTLHAHDNRFPSDWSVFELTGEFSAGASRLKTTGVDGTKTE